MSDAGPVRRPLVMGILNVTPDSFSDGGEHATTEAAVEHGRRLVAQGADLVDVGGESTRPGAARVDEAEELRRVVPVVEALAAEGIKVSIDTTRARVARACVGVGAGIVNDVSGGLADPVMPGTVASLDVLASLGDEVGDLTVLFDSGVRSGSDVFTALALGADAVILGRPYVYGLALAGAEGVQAVVEHTLAELDLTMALMGHASVAEIHRGALAR